MGRENQRDLAQDLVLPMLLFAALGAMTWAVRGCSGFGGMDGCIFAGVTWGTAWWFLAREPGARQSRPYASGWIILALTVGIGVSGNRGWMQWPSFFDGHLQTNYALGQSVPIPRAYGFLWLFIAGVPGPGWGPACWPGAVLIGAVRPGQWCLRLACGIGAACLARVLFDSLPEVFLPLYKTMQRPVPRPPGKSKSWPAPQRQPGRDHPPGVVSGLPGLRNGAPGLEKRHAHPDRRPGQRNGLGSMPKLALGAANLARSRLQLVAMLGILRRHQHRPRLRPGLLPGQPQIVRIGPGAGRNGPAGSHPNLERFGAYLGLLLGLGLSVRNGLKGWANIYLGNENYWDARPLAGHRSAAPAGAAGAARLDSAPACSGARKLHPGPGVPHGDVFPHAYRLVWLVLLVQNAIAQLITGPHSSWNETAFSLYYVLLFLLSAVILHHFSQLRRR